MINLIFGMQTDFQQTNLSVVRHTQSHIITRKGFGCQMGLVQLKVEFKVFFKPIKKIWNNFFFMLFSTNKKKLKNYRISFNFENV